MILRDRCVMKGRLWIISKIAGKIYPPHCRFVDNLITNIGRNLAAEAFGALRPIEIAYWVFGLCK